MSKLIIPRALFVDQSSIQTYVAEPWEEVERDPRGILLMWEPPEKGAKYMMGMDPTHGITGWSRATRNDEDKKVDNGAIEIFKIDAAKLPIFKEIPNPSGPGYVQIADVDPQTKQQRFKYRDVQVAEFAAPCDAVEIARIANILGRIYCGSEEDACCCIWEAYPGPGILTTQELLRLGYPNLWMWEYIDSAAEETNRMGWRSTRESQKLLWYRSRRHLMERRAVIRSKWLLGEYSNAEIDMDKMRAKAAYGSHDDRFQAANMVFWAGHKWTYDIDRESIPVTSAPPVQDYQRYAPVLGDEFPTFDDWKSNSTSDWEE
jgi:hypothetical protein